MRPVPGGLVSYTLDIGPVIPGALAEILAAVGEAIAARAPF